MAGTVKKLADFGQRAINGAEAIPLWFFKGALGPLSSLVIKTHHWGIVIFTALLILINGDWILKNSLVCVNQSNGDKLPDNLLKICDQHHVSVGYDGQDKKTISMVYDFFQYLLIIFIFGFEMLRILEKLLDDKRIKEILEVENPDDKESGREDTKEKLTGFLLSHLGNFSNLYYRSIAVHLLAVSLDIIFIILLNYILQNKMMSLIMTYPWEKDVINFSDDISLVFAPFARCDINMDVGIMGLTTQNYVCFNRMALLYEKLTLACGVYLGVMAVSAGLHLVYLCGVLPTPWGRRSLLTTGGLTRSHEDKVLRWITVGDLLVLDFLRSKISGRQYTQVVVFMATRVPMTSQDKVTQATQDKQHDVSIDLLDIVELSGGHPA